MVYDASGSPESYSEHTLTKPATQSHRNLPSAWHGTILESMRRCARHIVQFLQPFLAVTALILALTSAVMLAPRAARADEITLKDGTKINGSIIGFEDKSFKVRTSYGYALVQKDQVVSINVANEAKVPPERKPEPAAEKAPAPENPAEPKKTVATAAAVAAARPAPASPAHHHVPAAPAVASLAAPQIPAPAANPAPPEPPTPEPIRETVSGNTYTNETYRFRMYKPPGWDVIGSAPAVLPGAIAAMGTDDQRTYLLIGQQPVGKSLAADTSTAEKRLRDVMENFRPLGEERVTISGTPVIEHRFRGSVDQHDWSGVVVLVPRGARVYTIFGMTRADNDLVQIQENVIARTISSLQFTE
jgi:hypothetical protein